MDKQVWQTHEAQPLQQTMMQQMMMQQPMMQQPMMQQPMMQFPSMQFPSMQFPTMQFSTMQFPTMQFPTMQFPTMHFPIPSSSMQHQMINSSLQMHHPMSLDQSGCVLTYEKVTVSVPQQSSRSFRRAANVVEVTENDDCELDNKKIVENETKKDSDEASGKKSENETQENDDHIEEVKKNSDDITKQEEEDKTANELEEAAPLFKLPVSFECRTSERPAAKRKGSSAGVAKNSKKTKPEKKMDEGCPRRTRSSSGKTSVKEERKVGASAGTSQGFDEQEERERILKELETVPSGMKASSKFHEEHLLYEANRVLEIVQSEECIAHLTKVVNGAILRNQSMMMGGGLGPFTLHKDLQTKLLDLLEQFDVGPNVKYQVILPEAIIFALGIAHQCSRSDALIMFAEQSAIVEHFEG